MEDHRHEEYAPPPKPKLQAFSGAGHKLGRLVCFNQSFQSLRSKLKTTLLVACLLRLLMYKQGNWTPR